MAKPIKLRKELDTVRSIDRTVTLTQLSKERAGLKAFYCPDPKDKNWAIELNGNNEMFDFIISTSMRFMFFRFPKGNQINLIEL